MNNTKESHKLAPTIEDKEIYKIAFETRNFEISLFWQRSNYFLILNTGLAFGYFNLVQVQFALPMAIFGLVASFLWYQVNLGSKFWQSRWEERLAHIERAIAPDLEMFDAKYATLEDDVRKSQELRPPKSRFRRWLNDQIFKKPSVSVNMTILSMVFMAAWILAICVIPILGSPAMSSQALPELTPAVSAS